MNNRVLFLFNNDSNVKNKRNKARIRSFLFVHFFLSFPGSEETRLSFLLHLIQPFLPLLLTFENHPQ